MALNEKVVLLTGASMGIGEAIAHALAGQGARLALEKLKELSQRLQTQNAGCKVTYYALDVGSHEAVDKGVAQAVKDLGQIDILINNAGLALGTPARFPELKISDIVTMNNTNVNGGEGTILNITSTTALEAPPFPGETVYHANKALQEAFTNALRNELNETNIRVLALRPGVVATHFHTQRVGFDKEMYDGFMKGFQPLLAEDVSEAAVFMLSQPLNRSVKALDVVPSAQRSLNVFDRKWNERNGKEEAQM
ncbi:nadp-dependent l-serine l-allo-threonine dehydrogenase ydfg [Seiridium cupressi]